MGALVWVSKLYLMEKFKYVFARGWTSTINLNANICKINFIDCARDLGSLFVDIIGSKNIIIF